MGVRRNSGAPPVHPIPGSQWDVCRARVVMAGLSPGVSRWVGASFGRGSGGIEGTFARRVPGAPRIQMNVPAIHHNALPANITLPSSPGTLSTSTLYDCWRSIRFPFFRPKWDDHSPTLVGPIMATHLKIKESRPCA